MTKYSNSIFEQIQKLAKAVVPHGSRVILYGSRARGEENASSDWDILVILDKPKIEQDDYDGISFRFASLCWKFGETISPVMYTKNEWQKCSFTPFYKNVQQDGIELL